MVAIKKEIGMKLRWEIQTVRSEIYALMWSLNPKGWGN